MNKFRKWLIPALLIGAGFAAGLVFFFPLSEIVTALVARNAGSSGLAVDLGPVRVTTGYALGFSKGSLFGLRVRNLRFTLPNGSQIRCEESVLAPRIWPLLIGQLQTGVSCQSKALGDVKALVKASPAWGPKTINASVSLAKVDVKAFESFLKGGYAGRISGELDVVDFKLGGRGLPPLEWELSGQNVQIPAVTTQMFVMPAVRVGPLKTTGRLRDGKLNVPKLEFGAEDTTVEGNLKLDLTLNATGFPSAGQWSGRLRTSSDFESAFTDIDLTKALGPTGSDGFRQFSKNL